MYVEGYLKRNSEMSHYWLRRWAGSGALVGLLGATCVGPASCASSTSGGTGLVCNGGATLPEPLLSESTNDACGSPSTLLGTKLAGESCSATTDCKPTCCACGGSNPKNGLATVCQAGKCATSNDVCCTFAASASCGR